MSDTAAPPYTEVTDDSIAVLIDRFYVAVRRDPVLGPVFETTIAEDEWPEHLATMHRFWSSVMLTSGRYTGNPVSVHRAVQGLERPMFARWLALFEATAADLFAPEPAALFADKARRIATSLQLALFHRLGAPPDGLPARAARTEGQRRAAYHLHRLHAAYPDVFGDQRQPACHHRRDRRGLSHLGNPPDESRASVGRRRRHRNDTWQERRPAAS